LHFGSPIDFSDYRLPGVTTYLIGLPLCADWKSAFLGTLCRAKADRRPKAYGGRL